MCGRGSDEGPVHEAFLLDLDREAGPPRVEGTCGSRDIGAGELRTVVECAPETLKRGVSDCQGCAFTLKAAVERLPRAVDRLHSLPNGKSVLP